MDILVLVAIKICIILFIIGGYYLGRSMKQKRLATVVVTQDIPGQGYSNPVSVHVVDAQQYNNLGFAQLTRNPSLSVPAAAQNIKNEPTKQ
uniref:Uncharacterized protein n=1 Tax=Anopheles minimus TaxID=112268 RepID=A0A182WIP5_9DIPT